MGLELLLKGRSVKELSTKWPIVDPGSEGAAFVGTFQALSERPGENGAFNTYTFSNCHGNINVRVGKDLSRALTDGETVTISGKALDDEKASFTIGREYGLEFTGYSKAKKGRQPMKLWRIVEIGA